MVRAKVLDVRVAEEADVGRAVIGVSWRVGRRGRTTSVSGHGRRGLPGPSCNRRQSAMSSRRAHGLGMLKCISTAGHRACGRRQLQPNPFGGRAGSLALSGRSRAKRRGSRSCATCRARSISSFNVRPPGLLPGVTRGDSGPTCPPGQVGSARWLWKPGPWTPAEREASWLEVATELRCSALAERAKPMRPRASGQSDAKPVFRRLSPRRSFGSEDPFTFACLLVERPALSLRSRRTSGHP
jgi:hypothetical protein